MTDVLIIQHHGVKGQKWGVRNKTDRLGIEKRMVKRQAKREDKLKVLRKEAQLKGIKVRPVTKFYKDLDKDLQARGKVFTHYMISTAVRNAANKTASIGTGAALSTLVAPSAAVVSPAAAVAASYYIRKAMGRDQVLGRRAQQRFNFQSQKRELKGKTGSLTKVRTA